MSRLRGLTSQTFEKEHKKTAILIWVVRILVVAAIIFLVWAQNNLVIPRTYIYATQDLPKSFVGYKIVHISDICNTPHNLISAVQKEKPDVIIISGGFENEAGAYNNSVNAVIELCKIAPVYYIYNTNDSADCLAGTGAINVTDQKVGLSPNQLDLQTFIENNYGNKIIDKAKSGDEKAVEYIEYLKEELENTSNSQIYICGIGNYVDEEDPSNFIANVYKVIGPDATELDLILNGNLHHTNAICRTDVDIQFVGGTFGKTSEFDYKKGLYGQKGATVAVSGGVGNLGDTRVFNLPEFQVFILSDGTIKEDNPLEDFIDIFVKDVGTIYDNDGGFKEYSSSGKEIINE